MIIQQSVIDPVLSIIVVESVSEFVDILRPQVAVICSDSSVDQTVEMISLVSSNIDGLNYCNLDEGSDTTAQIVVGTFGSFVSFMDRGELDHEVLKLIVFSDFGNILKKQDSYSILQSIVNTCNSVKQLVSFSSSYNGIIHQNAESLMTDPRTVTLSDPITESLKRLKIYHALCSYSEDLFTKKIRSLFKVLMKSSFHKALVFTDEEDTGIEIAKVSRTNNLPGISLPTDEPNYENNYRIFIAKNRQAVEGLLDLNKVSIVINFNMPNDIDQFIQNVTCASTNGTIGVAMTIGTKSQIATMRKYCEELKLCVSPVPPRMNETYLEYCATHRFNYRIPAVPNPLLPEYKPLPISESYLLNTSTPHIKLDMDSIMDFLFEKGGDENRWCVEDRIRLEKYGVDFSFLDNFSEVGVQS
jgi:hypothetical protein